LRRVAKGVAQGENSCADLLQEEEEEDMQGSAQKERHEVKMRKCAETE